MHRSDPDLAALLARIGTGSIFVAQGWRKLFAEPGAPHGRLALQKTLESSGWPAAEPLALAVGITELGCGAIVLVGLRSRLAVAPLLGILGAAIGQVKWRQGFLGGWDWPYSVAIGALTVLVLGGGRFSLDGLLHTGHR